MTVNDLLDRIRKYPKGFRFTLQYNQMTDKIRKDVYKIMKMAIDQGLVESVEIGAGWDEDGTFNGYQNETFVRR